MSRSNLLTHWTGKDIETDINKLNSVSRNAYVNRVRDTLRHGLWMTKPGELLEGMFAGKSASIQLQPNMTCFTELRLSSSERHTNAYGLLGFVVTRQFVLDHGGGPVHYLRQHDDDPFVGLYAMVMQWVAVEASDIPDSDAIQRALMLITAYLKPMSTKNTDDFVFLNEQEWRIVQSGRAFDTGHIIRTDLDIPYYRIPLRPHDIKMLVVPDEKVRELVSCDDEIKKWSDGRSIAVLTIEEIASF